MNLTERLAQAGISTRKYHLLAGMTRMDLVTLKK